MAGAFRLPAPGTSELCDEASWRPEEAAGGKTGEANVLQREEQPLGCGLTAEDDEVNGGCLIVEQPGQLNPAVVEAGV